MPSAELVPIPPCTPEERARAITDRANAIGGQLRGALAPVYQRAILTAAMTEYEVQGALCSEAMAALAREHNEVVLHGSLAAVYGLAIRWSTGGTLRQGLQGELLSTLMREENEDVIRGSLIVIYSLAAHLSVNWETVVKPAIPLYPFMGRKSLSNELAQSLRPS